VAQDYGIGPLLILAGAVAVWAISGPRVRGNGKTATINGKLYVLHGIFERRLSADHEAAALRRTWKSHGMTGSVRIIAKKYRGTARLWAVYSHSGLTRAGYRAAVERVDAERRRT
jgi:hypothetical protein